MVDNGHSKSVSATLTGTLGNVDPWLWNVRLGTFMAFAWEGSLGTLRFDTFAWELLLRNLLLLGNVLDSVHLELIVVELSLGSLAR